MVFKWWRTYLNIKSFFFGSSEKLTFLQRTMNNRVHESSSSQILEYSIVVFIVGFPPSPSLLSAKYSDFPLTFPSLHRATCFPWLFYSVLVMWVTRAAGRTQFYIALSGKLITVTYIIVTFHISDTLHIFIRTVLTFVCYNPYKMSATNG